MSTHPIEGLMKTAMENLKAMVDVNTIVGDPVTTPDGTVIMPISKVGFGFAAGGSEFNAGKEQSSKDRSGGVAPFDARENASSAFPFGGGSGGGVSITPIAFLVVGVHGVKILPLDRSTHLFEKVMDFAPQMADRIQMMFSTSKSAPPTTTSPLV
jgi:sporulation protein YtfJ